MSRAILLRLNPRDGAEAAIIEAYSKTVEKRKSEFLRGLLKSGLIIKWTSDWSPEHVNAEVSDSSKVKEVTLRLSVNDPQENFILQLYDATPHWKKSEFLRRLLKLGMQVQRASSGLPSFSDPMPFSVVPIRQKNKKQKPSEEIVSGVKQPPVEPLPMVKLRPEVIHESSSPTGGLGSLFGDQSIL